jgi:hypothetical protein
MCVNDTMLRDRIHYIFSKKGKERDQEEKAAVGENTTQKKRKMKVCFS